MIDTIIEWALMATFITWCFIIIGAIIVVFGFALYGLYALTGLTIF